MILTDHLGRQVTRESTRLRYAVMGRFVPRTLILAYHRVVPDDWRDPLRMRLTAAGFEKQLCWLSSYCPVVSLDTLAEQLRKGSLPRRQVVITFDDGYRDNRICAAPVLRRLGLPATFYLTGGWIGASRRSWWDEVEARLLTVSEREGEREFSEAKQRELCRVVHRTCSELRPLPPAERDRRLAALGAEPAPPHPLELPMSWDEAREMAAMGFTLGAHSMDHPALSGLDEELARREISESKRVLEEQLGQRVAHFAYPYDEAMRRRRRVPAFLEQISRSVGLETAGTVVAEPVTRWSNPQALPRMVVGDWSLDRFQHEIARFI